MFNDLNLTWKMVGLVAAIFFIIRFVVRTFRKPAPSESPVVHARVSFTGRIGSHLIAHAILSTITGILGFNVVMALLSIVLAIPLMLIGAKVELPEFVKSVPRNAAARIKDAFADTKEKIVEKVRDKQDEIAEGFHEKKEAVVDTIHDVKDAVVRRLTGKKSEPVEEDSVSMSSDAYWGGPPDPDVTKETRNDEVMAFDAMPPELKIAAFEAATPIDDASLPKGGADDNAPVQWYKVRCGKSSYMYTTEARIAMYRALWTGDREQTSEMDPKERTHITRLSKPPKQCNYEDCWKNLGRLSADELFAVCNASRKFKRPLPDQVKILEGWPRDEQYYEMRVCCHYSAVVSQSKLEEIKNAAFEAMREQEAFAIRERHNRPAQIAEAAREKAKDLAGDLKAKAVHIGEDLKEKATEEVNDLKVDLKAKTTRIGSDAKGRAARLAGDLKTKAVHVGGDLKEKAEEGVKEGASKAAKGMLWKALGF